jgi:hypothetical protein
MVSTDDMGRSGKEGSHYATVRPGATSLLTEADVADGDGDVEGAMAEDTRGFQGLSRCGNIKRWRKSGVGPIGGGSHLSLSLDI